MAAVSLREIPDAWACWNDLFNSSAKSNRADEYFIPAREALSTSNREDSRVCAPFSLNLSLPSKAPADRSLSFT